MGIRLTTNTRIYTVFMHLQQYGNDLVEWSEAHFSGSSAYWTAVLYSRCSLFHWLTSSGRLSDTTTGGGSVLSGKLPRYSKLGSLLIPHGPVLAACPYISVLARWACIPS